MISLWPQLEEAWRDTLIHKAQVRSLAVLAELYGFPWPQDEADEAGWRGALHVMGLGPRVTLPSIYWALEAALSKYNEVHDVTFDPGVPFTLDRVTGAWDDTHINRLVRTKYGLHWSVGPSPTGVDQGSLQLSPYSTSYWDGFPELTEAETLEAVVLPFVLRQTTPTRIGNTDQTYPGTPCRIEIDFYANEISRFRPTYLVDSATTWVITGDQANDRLVFPAAHGLNVGDQIMVFAQLNVFGGFDIPGPHPHLVPAPLVHGTVYYVESVPTATTVRVSATNGGPFIPLTTDGTGRFYATDMSTGLTVGDPSGHLLTDEHVLGNPSGDGPFPVYLDDGAVFASVLRSMDRVTMAGVRTFIGWYPLREGHGWTVEDI